MPVTKRISTFNFVNTSILIIVLLVVLYPLYFIVIASISDPNLVLGGKVLLIPKGISLNAYERVFSDDFIWSGYLNTIFLTVVGTFISLAVTITAAFALSFKHLKGRNIIMVYFIITMFFNGGLIPFYLLVNDLGLINTYWALLLPTALNVWNLIVARIFLQNSLPPELYDAARMDGCSQAKYFLKVALPISTTILVIIGLFYAIVRWNAYFDAMIFLNDRKRYPLQLIIRGILIESEASSMMMSDIETQREQRRMAELLKYGIIVVSSAPLIMVYPFLQKYFIKGILIGSIKG